MGKVLSSIADYCPDRIARAVINAYTRRRRAKMRKLDELYEDEVDQYEDHVAKKQKLMCTGHYIYNALYVEGKASDITIQILNKDWKLHKVYLSQSQYFNSMFSGGWDESDKSLINIEVEDPNITVEALDTVFSSFYREVITIEPNNIVGVLAASTMFQHEGLIELCNETMLRTLSPATAMKYYRASFSYGSQKVKAKALEWFLINLTDYVGKNINALQEIDIDFMSIILSHPDLLVFPDEMALYNVLKKWMYYRLNSGTESSNVENLTDIESFFRKSANNVAFLLTESGSEYLTVFRQLRLANMILLSQDYNTVLKDRIIPESWLLSAIKNRWVTFLDIASGNDKGPDSLNENFFNGNCLRCGTIISNDNMRTWRWIWFAFGVDMLWYITGNNILVLKKKRHCGSETNVSPMDHSIILQVDLFNLDQKRQIKRRQRIDPIRVVIAKNQELKIANLDSSIEYPLYVSIKLQLWSNPTSTDNEKDSN